VIPYAPLHSLTATLLWTLAAVNAIGLDSDIREETNDNN
jgi:hypothetical protein